MHGSKGYIENGVQIYETLEKELVHCRNDFADILDDLSKLGGDLKELEYETRRNQQAGEFLRKVKNFESNLELLEKIKREVVGALPEFKSAISKRDFNENAMTMEEAASLKERTRQFLELIQNSLNALKPIRDDVAKMNRQSRICLDNARMYDSRIVQIMEGVYRHSRGAQNKIEQVARSVSINAKKGNLHDIIMTNSLISSGIELGKKDTTKR